MKNPYKWIGGRDLSFEFDCVCLDKKWAGKPELSHLFKSKIRLSGYADDFFFDKVNATPRKVTCDCKKEYFIQWFRDGVEVSDEKKDQ